MGDKALSETALALNAWWRSQREWPSWAAAARALGIPKTTFRDYFFGSEPKGKHRKTLFEATGLAALADAAPAESDAGDSETVSQAERRLDEVAETLRTLSEQFASLHNVFEELKHQRGPARILPFKKREPATARAKSVEGLMYQIIAALESFRSSAQDRAILRQTLHGPDVGYLVTLMNALQDEKKYETWDALSSYRPLGSRR
jgi:hypothetical protein